MRLARVNSTLDYRLQTNFEVVRKQLLQDKYAQRLEKPLAYWALPRDRRLPLAFLGRTLGDLVNTPFQDLVATPGVGQKKMQSLVQLMQRATEEQQRRGAEAREEGRRAALGEDMSGERAATGYTMPRPNGHFDPTLVSELVWYEWCETVRRHRLGHEKLGRLAPSLQLLPTVIWHAPLSTYADRSVAEIRSLKTYGEKRVRIILEVFYTLHNMLAKADVSGGLSVSLLPAFVPPLAGWIDLRLRTSEPCSCEELQRELVEPLLEQLGTDGGSTVRDLAATRLGVQAEPANVRVLARRLGVTRARIYQLLDECEKIMAVRWPEGSGWFDRLTAYLVDAGADSATLSLLDATRQLCWPQRG